MVREPTEGRDGALAVLLSFAGGASRSPTSAAARTVGVPRGRADVVEHRAVVVLNRARVVSRRTNFILRKDR